MKKTTNRLNRAIAVNNKPQYYKPQEIAIALDIIRTLDVSDFAHPIQKDHLAKALEYHLANRNSASNTTISPSNSFVQ